jgi:hypothetical protein
MIGMHVDIFQKITSRVGGRRSDHCSLIGNDDLIQLISSPEATKDSDHSWLAGIVISISQRE